ncbi:HYC_CC_PP family protein [Taibaiella chishuiensis]|uniref:Uncharacterized protein n=1 Tax=Taibaiella chishuiensis TaxID=1434707 RepID=A0A2P8D897_9BACT|nr:hypothetical protein [Taibaiella chishuiensis]PSK93438.1 hypothetical protein B0I18_102408 [Taibaiella chishuiensis]
MKKFVAVILIVLLAANVSGATLSYHFCGKILQRFALDLQKQQTGCCCSKMEQKKEKRCCKTKHCKVTVDESKSLAKQLSFSKTFMADAVLTAPVQVVVQQVPLPEPRYRVPPAHAPPSGSPVPLHILYQQFLI